MISRIDHIAIAVKDYPKALEFFTKILGAMPGSSGDDKNINFFWQNLALGDLSRLELITSIGEKSFLDKFFKEKDAGVHHITLQTPNIHEAKRILEEKGIPYFGFADYGPMWKEIFIHPRDAFGVLIQIAEFKADDWISSEVKMLGAKKWNIKKTEGGCVLSFAHPGGGKVAIELEKNQIKDLVEALKVL